MDNYTFWGKWIIIEIGDMIYVKDDKGKWHKRTIKYHKRKNEVFPPILVELLYDPCHINLEEDHHLHGKKKMKE